MTEVPGAWQEIEPRYPFQEDRWQNTESGQVLVIEGKQEPWHEDKPPELSLSLVSEDFKENPDPIRTIVESSRAYESVYEAAMEWMNTHPTGV